MLVFFLKVFSCSQKRKICGLHKLLVESKCLFFYFKEKQGNRVNWTPTACHRSFLDAVINPTPDLVLMVFVVLFSLPSTPPPLPPHFTIAQDLNEEGNQQTEEKKRRCSQGDPQGTSRTCSAVFRSRSFLEIASVNL